MNLSPADEVYLCPYCGGQFVVENGKLVRARLEAARMKEELEDALKETPLGAQLADEEKKRERKKKQEELLELRFQVNETRRMASAALSRGIGVCILLMAVIIILSLYYGVGKVGLPIAGALAAGTYFYLSSYHARLMRKRVGLQARIKELEKDVYENGLPVGD